MNKINIETAKTSELLAFYNEHAEKTVNKFTNLETARRRVTALVESLEVSAAAKAPAKSITKLPEAKPAREPNAKAKPGYEVEHAETGDRIVPATRKSNAAGIAASWNDPAVREARLTRQGVIVSAKGKFVGEYNSTQAAFEALGLPTSKAIRFRMELKAKGKADFTFGGKSYEFSIL